MTDERADHLFELCMVLVRTNGSITDKLIESFERADRTSDELLRLGVTMLPLVLAKFADGRVPALGRDDLALAAIRKFLNDLTQEEFITVLKAVSPDKRLALLEIYKHLAGEGAPKGPKGEDPLPDESA